MVSKVLTGIFAAICLMVPIGVTNSALAQEVKIGRSTGLEIPRFVSLRSDEAYLRRGPSLDYPIEWVYQRPALPVRIIGESGHWRKVETPYGDKGWFHKSLLNGQRTAIITTERVQLNEIPTENAQIVAILLAGAIGDLLACQSDWCQLEIISEGKDYEGWVRKADIWGADAAEVFGDGS